MDFFILAEAQKKLEHAFETSLIYLNDWIYTAVDAWYLVTLRNSEGPV